MKPHEADFEPRTPRARRPRPANLACWVSEPPPADVQRSLERLARAEDVQRVVALADVHLAGPVCVGAVVATTRLIYPQAIGADIGCGMAAVPLDAGAEALAPSAAAADLLQRLAEAIPILRHPHLSDAPHLPAELRPEALSDPRLAAVARREGRIELGTLGRGNHFLELRADEEDRLWLVVHSGSRAVGQVVSAFHLQRAEPRGSGLGALEADSPAGQACLSDFGWTERFAFRNRDALIASAVRVLGARCGIRPSGAPPIHISHNHVQRETAGAGGERLYVHRKGANPAHAGQAGIIPGSMNAATVLVTGRGCHPALCSSSHGAGRRWPRAEARRRVSVAELLRQMQGVCFDERLATALRDEAPQAYRDLDAVLRAQRKLVRIDTRLRPLICLKGAG